MATDRTKTRGDHDSNPDPITGAPGSHPTGVGIGTASGAATGAAVGMLGGPIGAAIGAIAGGIVGGLVGKGVGEAVDPTEDDNYWRGEHRNRPYYNAEHDYDRDLAPAYRYGSTVGTHVNDTYPDASYRDATGTNRGTGVVDSVKSAAANVGHKIADAGREVKDKVAGDRRDRDFDTYEQDLRNGWGHVRGESNLDYDDAKPAIRDAFDRRVNRAGTGTSGNLGTTGTGV